MKHTLWTIQHIEAYHRFQETGILRADESHLCCKDDFRHAYDWMAEKCREKIGLPPEGVNYPVWAWYQWEGKRKRMDQRCSGYAMRGTPLVQLTIEMDDSEFLLSDFDEWHYVIWEDYIAYSEKEYDDFYEKEMENKREIMVESWEKIFDLNWYAAGWGYPPEEKSIQAVMWEIRRDQVKKAEFFTAK